MARKDKETEFKPKYMKYKYIQEKKRLEFAQKQAWITMWFSLSIVLLTILINVWLIYIGKPSITTEFLQIVTIYGGITSSISAIVYNGLALGRDMSKNRYGLSHRELAYQNKASELDVVTPLPASTTNPWDVAGSFTGNKGE